MEEAGEKVRRAVAEAERLERAGDRDGAIAALGTAVALAPRLAPAHERLGLLLQERGRVEEAIVHFGAAADLRPGEARAWSHLGVALLAAGRAVGAARAFEHATRADTGRASAWARLGSAYLHLGRNAEALEALARAEALAPPDAAAIGSNRLVALHYDDSHDAVAIFEAHRAWAARYAPPAATAPLRNDRGAERALRVGYVSPRFHGTSLSSLLEPVLASHDPRRVEVWCYASQPVEDEVTRRIRGRVARWIDAAALDDAALAERMRADAIDVAVDLSGHTPGHRLLAFARKPAPVCVTWLDYFDTTGLATMDCIVSDAWHSPPGDAQRFTEEVARLERIRFCYAPPAYAPAVTPPPASRGSSAPVLGSFNRMRKVSARTLRAWAAALEAVPGARLVVKGSMVEHAEERDAFAARFRAHGIDPARIEWRAYSGHAEMLAEYGDLDLALDTFPYNGGITTLEALWMGRPVVTVRGDAMISRQTAALLASIGLEELVAEDERDFGRKVAALVADPVGLARLSAGLRERMRASPLLDPAGMAAALEGLYARLWHAWRMRGTA